MLKEIRYAGLSRQPSDYECQDGELAVSINLIPEHGALRPILPPEVLMPLAVGMQAIFIHKTSSFTHLIIRDNASLSLLWLDAPSLLYGDAAESSPVLPLPLLSHADMLSCPVSIGNTLIIPTPSGLRYFLWQPDLGDYADLGSRIPFPEISFALASVPASSAEEKFPVRLTVPGSLIEDIADRWFPKSTAPGSGASRPHGSASLYNSPEYKSLVEDASTAVLAGLNKYIAEACGDGLFTEPFFVRYALRLFDGSHIMHSAPVLMLPNSGGPILPFTPSLKDSTFSADTKIIHSRCSLLYRAVAAAEEMAPWADIVTHIDIYISAPIYTFDQSGTVDPCQPAAAPAKFSHCGDAPRQANTSGDGSGDGSGDILFAAGNYERAAALPAGSGMEWNIGYRSPSEIADALTSQQASLFYLISSIETATLAPMDGYNYVDLRGKSLRNIQTRPRLEDDYQSHHTRIPSLVHVYNSRLNIASVTLRPFAGFALHAMVPLFAPPTATEGSSAKIYVKVRRDGRSIWTATPGYHPLPAPLTESNFPRWLFYPDSSATEMLIAEYPPSQPAVLWRIPLSSHDFLEGAYWQRGLGSELPDRLTGLPAATGIPELSSSGFSQPSKIYTSEVNNPFFFPVTGINTIGTGRILGICSAAKALSQGQFGQFPLYAFTTEGVWALEVASNGTFSARQPITRDVCINADGIAQLDSAVLFPTDRGIMLISGSQTQCISDSIASGYPFDALALPGFDRLHSMLGHVPESDTCLPALPFSEFLRKCRMIYDYVHQRVLVYAPGVSYAYVFSLESKQWGMTFSNIASHLNSYPDALAIDAAGNLVSLSSVGDCGPNEVRIKDVRTLFLTRPLKLGAPDLLKTVDTAIQRGLFRKGQVATALYGSRDLIRWHLVWSSRDHFLRGFRGTPFKYFRIAGVATLADGENLFGASVRFVPRLTNSPR